MDVIITPVARKQLGAMPKVDARRMEAALQQVADAYPQRLGFVTELVGEVGAWRLRKGDWRAVYFVTGETMTVVRVEKRGEVYQ